MTALSETVDILAHQGGWDEMALLGGPVLVMIVLGYLARRGISDGDVDDDEYAADPEDDDAESGPPSG